MKIGSGWKSNRPGLKSSLKDDAEKDDLASAVRISEVGKASLVIKSAEEELEHPRLGISLLGNSVERFPVTDVDEDRHLPRGEETDFAKCLLGVDVFFQNQLHPTGGQGSPKDGRDDEGQRVSKFPGSTKRRGRR